MVYSYRGVRRILDYKLEPTFPARREERIRKDLPSMVNIIAKVKVSIVKHVRVACISLLPPREAP